MKSHYEDDMQAAVFDWIRTMENKYPALKLAFHPANGGQRNLKEAKRLKRQGVRPGVSDIILLYPNWMYHGLIIELKFGKNKPTQYQKEFIANANKAGYQAIICYSSEEAINAIKKYLGIE